jgi:hypothetical protein
MPQNAKTFYIERRPTGDYAARRGGSQRASFLGKTQGEAADKARKSDPSAMILGERVRQRSGTPGKWRRLF